MKEVLLIILCVVFAVFALYTLYSMLNDFFKTFEKACGDAVEKRDREYEAEQETFHALKVWLFK